MEQEHATVEPEALLSRATQVSYITDDIDAFETRLRERFGVERFLIRHDHSRHSPASSGAILHMGLALVDDVELEIIQPNPEKASIYRDALALSGGVGRFHHVNHRLEKREQWREAEALTARLGLPVELQGGVGEDMRFAYPDARADFGHFLEFTYMEGAAAPSFPVPENRPEPGASLFGGCFQRGYVTGDLDAAMTRLSEAYRVCGFERTVEDGCRIARTWTGRFQLEVLQPGEGAPDHFKWGRTPAGQLMKLHHLGFAAADEAGFVALAKRAEALGLPVISSEAYGGMRAMYVDAREELGHFLKYLAPAQAIASRYG